MAISREFVVEEHEEQGNIGMRPLDMPNADPLSGMAVAHDLLEHFPNDNGSVEHEFMALGALLYVRGEDYFSINGSYNTDPAVHIASDFVEQYYYLIQRGNGLAFRNPGRTTMLDEDTELTFDRMFHEAKRNLRSAYQEEDDERFFLNDEQCRRARGWFRRGYRRAVRRYKSLNKVTHSPRMAILSLFLEIEKKADEWMKHQEEGMRCRITVNLLNRSFKLKELPWADY